MKKKLSLNWNYQKRPRGVVAPKSTHTASREHALAPFIHGKDRMPQRSTLYTRKVLALTPRQVCPRQGYRKHSSVWYGRSIRPTVSRTRIPFADSHLRANRSGARLLEILLYTSRLRHYPLSVCSFLVIGP